MVIEKKSLLIGILIGAVLLVAINSLTSADLRLSPDCPCSGDTTNPCLDGETYNPEDGSCSSGDGTGATGETGCQFEIYTYDGTFMGVTSAMMLKVKMPFTCILAETHSALPDSKAAAKIIEVLDKIVGFKLDPAPLLEQAEKFESKLKGMMSQSQEAHDLQEKKQMSYVG